MDLGATICTPRRPSCSACPLRENCAAFASGEPDAFPEPSVRRARPHKHGVAYWIVKEGAVWLVRRPAKGLLGGMAALPGPEWSDTACEPDSPLGTIRHIFTHFSLDLRIALGDAPIGDGWWHPVAALDAAGLPTLYRRAAAVALEASEELPLLPAAAA
jgi:A/G-specific adenine glycosylase